MYGTSPLNRWRVLVYPLDQQGQRIDSMDMKRDDDQEGNVALFQWRGAQIWIE